MENIITLMPPLSELVQPTGRRIQRIPRSAELPALVLRRENQTTRPAYLISVNRRVERIYALATVGAVVVMTAALVVTFGIYLASFAA